MTDRIMHINFKPQDMQLVREVLDNKSYSNIINYVSGLNGISIDMNKDISCNKLCNGITELILEIIRERNLKDYIWKNYTKIEDEEKQNVYIEAQNIFNKKEGFIKETIYNKVYEFFADNEDLNLDVDIDLDIDGFYKFRMKDFMSYISIVSDIALEEHLIKRDKKEFLESLKYFIDIQEEKMDLLKVNITKDGRFILSDEYGKLLEELNNQEIINIAMQENLNKEDILISAVMTLCPKRIEVQDNLKNNKSKDVIEILKLLFEGKVTEVYMN
ncbi:MAG: putative sporulation protein YtxC [Terrisporobacter sp.]|uniref:putative sporulation protein YtxC n=1 Tax=Terrisporobacter sp. TaxID=1965305 RepID=UPI002FC5A4B1